MQVPSINTSCTACPLIEVERLSSTNRVWLWETELALEKHHRQCLWQWNDLLLGRPFHASGNCGPAWFDLGEVP